MIQEHTVKFLMLTPSILTAAFALKSVQVFICQFKVFVMFLLI